MTSDNPDRYRYEPWMRAYECPQCKQPFACPCESCYSEDDDGPIKWTFDKPYGAVTCLSCGHSRPTMDEFLKGLPTVVLEYDAAQKQLVVSPTNEEWRAFDDWIRCAAAMTELEDGKLMLRETSPTGVVNVSTAVKRWFRRRLEDGKLFTVDGKWAFDPPPQPVELPKLEFSFFFG